MAAPVIDQYELDARTMIEVYRNKHPFNSYDQCILHVFKIMWHASVSLERIKAISEAVENIHHLDVDTLQKQLTKMTRSKLLRSRMVCGIRHYELNYGE